MTEKNGAEPRINLARQRYVVTRLANQDFNDVEVYGVTDTDVAERDHSHDRPHKAQVWFDRVLRTARCTSCSGPLSAMLSVCPHARAVQRYRRRLA